MNKGEETPRITWTMPATDYLLTIFGKHLIFISSCTIITFIAMMVALIILGPKYAVNASLLFKLGRELKPPPTLENTPIVAGRRPEDVTSAIEIMKSQALLAQLVEHFGEDFFFVEPEPKTFFQSLKAASRTLIRKVREGVEEVSIFLGMSRRLTRTQKIIVALQQGLVIEPVPKTDVISVRLITPDPEGGIELLKTLIDLYLAKHIAAYKTPKAKEFFEGQTEVLRQHLAQAEKARAELKEANAVWSVDEQRRQLLTQQRQLSELHSKTLASVALLQSQLVGLTKRIDALPRQLQLSKVVQRNPQVDFLKTRLLKLEASRKQLRTKYNDDSRTVTDLSQQINELQQMLQREAPEVMQSFTSGLNTVVQDVKKEIIQKQAALEGLQAQAQEQAHQLATLDAELRKIDVADVKLHRLEREINLLEQNYALYAKSLEDARISEAMDLAEISNVTVIAPPASTFIPVSPRKRLLLIAAFIIGFGGSFALVFLLEALHPTVHSRKDAEEILGVPVLLTIPEMPAT